MAPKAVVLYSGGLDSTTCVAVAQKEGFETYALSFRYGQRHKIELEKAQRHAKLLGVAEHKIVDINLRAIGGSALTDDICVPKDALDEANIPVTYVPARNTVFLAIALGWAEVLHAFDIFIGVNSVDYSGYPDCRPEFIATFERLANLATCAGVNGEGHFRIHTPLQNLSKGDIVRLAASLNVDFRLTHSCYDPDEEGRSCGRCDSCLLRLQGFREAGIVDPIPYQDH